MLTCSAGMIHHYRERLPHILEAFRLFFELIFFTLRCLSLFFI